MRNSKRIFYTVLLGFLLLDPFFALANNNGNGAITIRDPLGVDGIPELIGAIASFLANVAIIAAVIIFIVAGFQYYMAAGDPEKAKNAANTIKWALAGIVIILLAQGLADIVISILGG